MSDRRRETFCRPELPERRSRHALSTLPLSHHPARANAPLRGFSFHSEVQCLDVVSTESRFPAHPAASLAARVTSTTLVSSALSSTLPCAIAADAASTAPFHWRWTSRRSITCTRFRTEVRTPLATSSQHVPHAIGSRATCCRTSFLVGIRGPAQTSSAMRVPYIVH